MPPGMPPIERCRFLAVAAGPLSTAPAGICRTSASAASTKARTKSSNSKWLPPCWVRSLRHISSQFSVKEDQMKRIKLDRKDDKIKKFVRSLSKNSSGSILELEGELVLKVLPVSHEPIDRKKLKTAIRRRRDQSRELNKDWEAVDQE